jgi:hypothetical protein
MTSMQIDDDDEPLVESPLMDNIVEVTMHPLVLLSAADHYHRVARGTRKRVVGILLGSVYKGKVDCTNSFAIPFEEDNKNAVSIRWKRDNNNHPFVFLRRSRSSQSSGCLLLGPHFLEKYECHVS